MRPRSLRLPQTLDAAAARSLHAAILDKRGANLDLMGQAVMRPGTLALQVILSAAASWAREGLRFRLREPSAALLEAAETLGLPEGALGEERTR